MIYGNRYFNESSIFGDNIAMLESNINNDILLFDVLTEGTLENFGKEVLFHIKRTLTDMIEFLKSIIKKVINFVKKMFYKLKNGKVKEGEVEYYDYDFSKALEFIDDNHTFINILIDGKDIEKYNSIINDMHNSLKREKISQEVANKINNTYKDLDIDYLNGIEKSLNDALKEIEKNVKKMNSTFIDPSRKEYSFASDAREKSNKIRDNYKSTYKFIKEISKCISVNMKAFASCYAGNSNNTNQETT